VRIDTSALSFAPSPDVAGVDFAVLYESAWELVLLERWAPGISVAVPIPGGSELLVLDGSLAEGGEEFAPLSWLRLPAGAMLQATAGRGGCKLWVKSGHTLTLRAGRACRLQPDLLKRDSIVRVGKPVFARPQGSKEPHRVPPPTQKGALNADE
jgi:hypothetical protein